MEKSILSGLALIALSSCAAPRPILIQKYQMPDYYATPDNLKGSLVSRVAHYNSPYKLENTVINERIYYPSPNTYQEENELDFNLKKREEHKKIRDDENKQILIESDNLYIPTKLSGNKTRIPLSSSGKLGIKAKLTSYNVTGIHTQIIHETEKDAKYNIETIKIADQEFYIPEVEDAEFPNSNALPFYMLPVKSTKIEIDAEGKITLINKEGNIYRPLRISDQDYEKRKDSKSCSSSTGKTISPPI